MFMLNKFRVFIIVTVLMILSFFMMGYFSSYAPYKLKSEMQDWHLVQYDSQGKLHLSLDADYGFLANNSDKFNISNVRLKLYNSDGLVWDIKSDKAHLVVKDKMISLFGNVVANDTVKNINIQSEYLLIDFVNKTMSTDKQVKSTSAGSVTYIPKLHVKLDDVKIDMDKGFKSIYQID